jgi:hypothetical protein
VGLLRAYKAGGGGGAVGQGHDFKAMFGYQYGVFPLGGQAAVFSDYGPTVWHLLDVAFASINHGLYGEHHAGF